MQGFQTPPPHPPQTPQLVRSRCFCSQNNPRPGRQQSQAQLRRETHTVCLPRLFSALASPALRGFSSTLGTERSYPPPWFRASHLSYRELREWGSWEPQGVWSAGVPIHAVRHQPSRCQVAPGVILLNSRGHEVVEQPDVRAHYHCQASCNCECVHLLPANIRIRFLKKLETKSVRPAGAEAQAWSGEHSSSAAKLT